MEKKLFVYNNKAAAPATIAPAYGKALLDIAPPVKVLTGGVVTGVTTVVSEVTVVPLEVGGGEVVEFLKIVISLVNGGGTTVVGEVTVVVEIGQKVVTSVMVLSIVNVAVETKAGDVLAVQVLPEHSVIVTIVVVLCETVSVVVLGFLLLRETVSLVVFVSLLRESAAAMDAKADKAAIVEICMVYLCYLSRRN